MSLKSESTTVDIHLFFSCRHSSEHDSKPSLVLSHRCFSRAVTVCRSCGRILAAQLVVRFDDFAMFHRRRLKVEDMNVRDGRNRGTSIWRTCLRSKQFPCPRESVPPFHTSIRQTVYRLDMVVKIVTGAATGRRRFDQPDSVERLIVGRTCFVLVAPIKQV
jgi:hypothetical protein